MTIHTLQRGAVSGKTLDCIERYLSLSDKHRVSVGIYCDDKAYVLAQPYDDSDYRYDIGSISKTMTAHLILSLVEQGRISLFESVATYLPLKKGNYPTIEELLTHTAGYGHLTPAEITVPFLLTHSYSRKNIYENCTSKTVIKALERRRYRLKKKRHYGYSDFAFAILALVAERVEGRGFCELFEEFVHKKLAMDDTEICVEERKPTSVLGGEEIPYWIWNRKNPYVAAGGLVSTVGDMLKYISCQINSNGGYITAAQRYRYDAGDEKSKMGICFGWHTYQRSDQIWHVGGVGTFRSSVIVNRKRRFGVVVLGNAKGKNRANVHYLAKMIYSEFKKNKLDLKNGSRAKNDV